MIRAITISLLIVGTTGLVLNIATPTARAAEPPAQQTIDRDKIQSRLLDIRKDIDKGTAPAPSNTSSSPPKVNVCSLNPNLPQCKRR
jgi:hypothetical protein